MYAPGAGSSPFTTNRPSGCSFGRGVGGRLCMRAYAARIQPQPPAARRTNVAHIYLRAPVGSESSLLRARVLLVSFIYIRMHVCAVFAICSEFLLIVHRVRCNSESRRVAYASLSIRNQSAAARAHVDYLISRQISLQLVQGRELLSLKSMILCCLKETNWVEMLPKQQNEETYIAYFIWLFHELF